MPKTRRLDGVFRQKRLKPVDDAMTALSVEKYHHAHLPVARWQRHYAF